MTTISDTFGDCTMQRHPEMQSSPAKTEFFKPTYASNIFFILCTKCIKNLRGKEKRKKVKKKMRNKWIRMANEVKKNERRSTKSESSDDMNEPKMKLRNF